VNPVVRLAPSVTVPPILTGGNSTRAIDLVVRYGDGWMPSSLSSEALAAGAGPGVLRVAAAAASRTMPGITVAGGVVAGTDPVARDR
jgi:alkanesulfonate monooxygenase SsuD/methylene tetrahydromethanopterin reductase-like flavin-dependent oxidoreductase (luciferase family)